MSQDDPLARLAALKAQEVCMRSSQTVFFAVFKVASIASIAFMVNTPSWAAYIETTSFEKLSFKKKYELQKYKSLKDSKRALPYPKILGKDNYTVDTPLFIKSKGEFYFWSHQLKTDQNISYQKNRFYSLETFLPSPIKTDLHKVKYNSSHKGLSLQWLEWKNNGNLNKSILNKEASITNSDFQGIISEYTKELTKEKIKFGDIILFLGTDDIDNRTDLITSMIYMGNGIVLEKMELPRNKYMTKFSYLKDVQERYQKTVLDLRMSARRIKSSKQFNLANKMEEIKEQDLSLEANKNQDQEKRL